MRLRHIEIFHAIYTTGSITNAAKILHVSQPSVSKVLSHAELQLGFNLFDRVKGRLIPTDEAEMLFDEVDKIYQQMRSIKNTAQNIKKSEFIVTNNQGNFLKCYSANQYNDCKNLKLKGDNLYI